jgi:hypothetical protein
MLGILSRLVVPKWNDHTTNVLTKHCRLSAFREFSHSGARERCFPVLAILTKQAVRRCRLCTSRTIGL